MTTPYVSADFVKSWPTNQNWSQVPGIKSPSTQQINDLLNQLCLSATAKADNMVGQTLRATVRVEQNSARSYRVGVNPNGSARFLCSFFPIASVVSAQVAYSPAPPFTWMTIPNTYVIPLESPFSPFGSSTVGAATAGSQIVLIGGNYVSWWNGRDGQFVQITYIAGWPHGGLTATYSAGVSSLHVDDITAMNGANLEIPDVVNGTEFIQVTAVTADTAGLAAPSGPGTLTLQSPTIYPHSSGEIVTGMPKSVQEAVVWLVVASALSRSSSAVSAPPQQGRQSSSGGAQMDAYTKRAALLLKPYARLI